ncbi:uncharacterized protein LOC131025618 [Salvia miltiorrhiza]|uniref:uncharacterized protein LOC131003332 n=1 Tax=Salvia miltiorrhiza TaxID=226208 RepID=UPI0025ABCB89|nr:uncharacterized protein LOC131003332 [Salvia miltiorrhiza]XP_057811399.1 uncharacterized protein LOC131025618 [Salvia miltiorrhiza]
MESTKMGLVQEKWKSGVLKMKLVAEILTGSLFYVEVGADATVGDLKKEIGKQENLPGDRLILLLDAEERYSLDKDEASLKDYGVEDSSHIYIFFQDNIAASSASPLTPKESTSVDNTDEADEDEAPRHENASVEANEPSASVDQEE